MIKHTLVFINWNLNEEVHNWAPIYSRGATIRTNMHAYKCYKGNMQQDKCRKQMQDKCWKENMQNIMNEWIF
jgi:hypothetical protein